MMFLNWLFAMWLAVAPGTSPAVFFASTNAYAGTAVNDATVGTLAWTFTSDAQGAPDNLVAYCASSAYGITNYLKATNFGFSIPGGATISGVQVSVRKGYWLDITVKDSEVKLVKADGTIGSTNKSTGATWPAAPSGASASVVNYGGSSDTWGGDANTDWNDADCGVVLSADFQSGTLNSTAAIVDSVQITITYNTAPGMPRRTVISRAGSITHLRKGA